MNEAHGAHRGRLWTLVPSLLAILFAVTGPSSAAPATGPLPPNTPVRGWTILSSSEPDALATIAAAPSYSINQLQLSHQVVDNLYQLKDPQRSALTNRLIDAAHTAGISEVVLWDHAFYRLNYYPAEFRTGPGGTLDLDNAAFWVWFKADYRQMLDRAPHADGVVLTFIETGARAERQYSQRLITNQQKLAAVVNAVADVVIGERHLNLYARTFSYSQAEYENIIGAIQHFARPEVRLMMKETPHDFFLTHPNDRYAGTIARPTLIEFDAAGEFNGQGIIANTWPEYILGRWRDLSRRPHVIGYSVRTDRYDTTRLVGHPGEINLLALKRGAEDPDVTAEQVYDEFITAHYGRAALPQVKAAFRNAFDITTCSLYTLGTNIANHSALNYDPYASSYILHVSGKWLDPPIVFVGHGVNRELHYWRDVIDRLAPPFVKDPGNHRWDEVAWVRERGFIHPGEQLTEDILRDLVTEKDFGVRLAEESLSAIDGAGLQLAPPAAADLHHYFARTLLTARIRRAAALAYFGFRLWCRGEGFRSQFVGDTVQRGLAEIQVVAPLIRDYPVKPASGQWDWAEDAGMALTYFQWIVQDGWPANARAEENLMRQRPDDEIDSSRYPANPNAGMKFPYVRP